MSKERCKRAAGKAARKQPIVQGEKQPVFRPANVDVLHRTPDYYGKPKAKP